MRLTFYGAARTVTGSCYLVEAAGRRLLVDCGLFQGNRAFRERNWQRPGFDPAGIDAVLLTHAHIDHSGLLPRLVRQGFRGRIIATEATADLCAIMLPDSAHIQEMEAEWRGRKEPRQGRAPREALYTTADAEAALRLFAPVKYGQELAVFPSLRLRFADAGHILGSAFIEVMVREGGRETKIVFSGDLGQAGAPIIRDPSPLVSADCLLLESTYGDRLHEDMPGRRQDLAKVVGAAAATGGNLIIPAFAVERTQELLYDLKGIYDEGLAPRLPVFIDSPLAVSATEVFRRHPDCFDAETWALLDRGQSPLDFPELTFVREVEDSKALNKRKGSAVIISANGMCEAGRILHHLKHNLWRPESHLLFVGFQAEGTLGRRLLEGDKRVRVMGEEIAVRAAVHSIGSYSAHADRDGLLAWLRTARQLPRMLFLVHGEDTALAAWAATIRDELGVQAVVPSFGETYSLAETAVLAAASARTAPEAPWAGLLAEMDLAYRDLAARLQKSAPAEPKAAARLEAALRRVIRLMAKAG
ncbi:MAG: MBL fold metallo-hydrolase RNA specificity domain-containing protein [Patescibacteria group bacterium]